MEEVSPRSGGGRGDVWRDLEAGSGTGEERIRLEEVERDEEGMEESERGEPEDHVDAEHGFAGRGRVERAGSLGTRVLGGRGGRGVVGNC